MNAGAYGGEIKDVLAEVDVLLADGTLKTLTNEEMAFSYRHSNRRNGCSRFRSTFPINCRRA